MRVSVLMLTYNHAPFIEQAVQSALAQEIEGGHEILISEDCSTDGTREIVRELARRHPGQIRLFLSERNLNTNEVLARILSEARGRYLALLEGDDYWTSPLKLEKEASFLDRHPECAICFHNVTVVYEDDPSGSHPYHMAVPTHRISKPLPKPISTLKDLVPGNFMATCSVMFRAGLLGELPEWYNDLSSGDWPLHVLNAQHGKIGYLDEILGAYRVHAGGLWSMNRSRARKMSDITDMISTIETLDRHLEFRYQREIRHALAFQYAKASHLFFQEGRYGEAARYARESVLALPLTRHWRHRAQFMKMFLRARFPRLYVRLRSLKSRVGRS